MKSPFLFLLIFSSFFLTAQTGPGGVGNTSANGLWLDANTITVPDGTPVPLWNDRSGNGNNAFQSNTINQPLLNSNSALNSYPSIDFDGIQGSNSDWMQVADAAILDGTTSMRYFAVVRPEAIATPQAVQPIFGKRIDFANNPVSNANYAYTFFFNGTPLFVDIVRNDQRLGTATTFSSNTNYLLGFGFDGSLPQASRTTIANAGLNITTGQETATAVLDSNQPLTLGILNLGYNRYFNGQMAEIIHFNRELNATEFNIVNNYLSAKYNIPIDPSIDYYTQDDPANGDFDHDVAGIGREPGTAFPSGMHLDSQGTGIVRISSPTSVGSGDYLFWGRDTKSGVTPSFIINPSDNNLILDTKWRVSNVSNGVGGNLTFEIDLTGIINPDGCDELQLIIDNDSDFSSPKFPETLSLSGTIATATSNVGFEDGDYFTIVRNNVVIYDGATWFNGSGSGNIPNLSDSCKDLYILSNPRVDFGNFHVRSINMLGNSTLRVNNDEVAIVENGIFIDTNARIILRNRSQLLQNHTGANLNSGDGILKVRQQGTANRFNYNFWSSPVNRSGDWQLQYLENNNGPILFSSFSEGNPSAGDNPLTLSGRWLYTYNGARNDYNAWNYVGASGSILPGEGYTMKGSGIGTGSYTYFFEGIPNSGDISIPVTANGSVLIGNPYPSALDMDQFLSDNAANTTATAYFYEQFDTNNSHLLNEYEGGYATRNMMMGTPATADTSGLTSGIGTASKPAPNQFTAVAQGFFMDTTTGADIIFNNAQRDFVLESDANGSVFYRSASGNANPTYGGDTRTKLTLSFSKPNAYVKYLGLGYDTRATVGVDNGFDAIDKNEEPDGMRWYLEQNDYIIQALPQFDVNDILPLNFNIRNAGNYTIDIESMVNTPASFEVYLHDQLNDVEYKLHDGPVTIALPIMNKVTDRFSIRFQTSSTLTVDTVLLENISLQYLNRESSLEIINPTSLNVQDARVFHINGQMLYSIENPKSRELLRLNSGIYIVQLTMDNGLQLSEKILVE
jgi:hypothetical protein